MGGLETVKTESSNNHSIPTLPGGGSGISVVKLHTYLSKGTRCEVCDWIMMSSFHRNPLGQASKTKKDEALPGIRGG